MMRLSASTPSLSLPVRCKPIEPRAARNVDRDAAERRERRGRCRRHDNVPSHAYKISNCPDSNSSIHVSISDETTWRPYELHAAGPAVILSLPFPARRRSRPSRDRAKDVLEEKGLSTFSRRERESVPLILDLDLVVAPAAEDVDVERRSRTRSRSRRQSPRAEFLDPRAQPASISPAITSRSNEVTTRTSTSRSRPVPRSRTFPK